MATLTAADAQQELARRELARRHLIDWCTYAPPTEQGAYVPQAWHRDLAERLERVYRETAERRHEAVRRIHIYAIDALPQEGKSEQVSRRGPAWAMATLGLSFAVTSYSGSLALEHSERTRNMLQSPEARAVWPHVAAGAASVKRSERVSDWSIPWKDSTREGPQFIARGRRGALTGRSPDIIVTDDLFGSEEDYASVASRRQTGRFLRSVVFPRLMARGGTLMAMGTRWGTSDEKAELIRMVEDMRKKGREVVFEHWQYPLHATGNDALGREAGAYNYDGWDSNKEDVARDAYGNMARAILDCDPLDPSGGIFQRAHFEHRYEMHPAVLMRRCSARYLVMDAAETAGAGDYTVIQHWGVWDGKLCLLEQWRGQWDELRVAEELGRLVGELRPMGTLVETASSGKVAIAALKASGVPGIVPVSHSGQGSKLARIGGTRLLWKQGAIRLPEPHGEVTDWLYKRDTSGSDWIDRQLALRGERSDMRGEVDDEADAASTMIRWWMEEGERKEVAAPEFLEALARIGGAR